MKPSETSNHNWSWITGLTTYLVALLIVFWTYQSYLLTATAMILAIYYGILFVVPAGLPYRPWKQWTTWIEFLIVLFCTTLAVGLVAGQLNIMPPVSTCVLIILGLLLIPVGKRRLSSNRFTTGLILSGALLTLQPILAIVQLKFQPPLNLEYLKQARQEFPETSLDHRLQALNTPSMKTGFPTEVKLLEERQDFDNRHRSRRLEAIHSRYFQRFVKAYGFGVGRMGSRDLADLRLPPLLDQPFSTDEPTQHRQSSHSYESQSPTPLPDSYHQQAYLNFLTSDSFGFTNDHGLTTGFQPHGFKSTLPVGTRQKATSEEATSEEYTFWKLQRLELVSLLRFQQPQVYVLEHLPRMDQLASDSIQTRALTAFEQDALRRIEENEELIVIKSEKAQPEDRLQMVGAIPALQRCLSCHQGETGQLLGAFSYQFVKVPSSEAEADKGQ